MSKEGSDMKLVDEIKNALELEQRTPEDSEKYFEAVFQSKDTDALCAILKKHLGESLKPPGKGAKFPKEVGMLVDNIGGLRSEQSFYFKQEPGGEYIYAALWPWQSDLSKTTLKIGMDRF
jgi:hypothetical protein